MTKRLFITLALCIHAVAFIIMGINVAPSNMPIGILTAGVADVYLYFQFTKRMS